MKSVIYETKGRAREFNELALNIYNGCDHSCVYCYGADVTHQDKITFSTAPKPRVTPSDIEHDAERLERAGETRSILLCFVCDPYAHIDDEGKLTRTVISILKSHHLRVTILTKGGLRSMRDFDLLTPQDEYATTLTCIYSEDSEKWEPKAAIPADRITALIAAHKRGIPTWVSFEPVIYPDQTLQLARTTAPFVGFYRVGTMNYHPHGKTIDWGKFLRDIEAELQWLNKTYYIKKDLAKYKGLNEGYWWRAK